MSGLEIAYHNAYNPYDWIRSIDEQLEEHEQSKKIYYFIILYYINSDSDTPGK